MAVDLGTALGSASSPSSVTLAYAFKGDLFVLGVGDTFVKAVLDTTSATSLASDPRYSAALAAAGGPTDSSVAYADLTAIRGLVEAQLPADQKAAYTSDVQPYLAAFDRLVSVRVDARRQRVRHDHRLHQVEEGPRTSGRSHPSYPRGGDQAPHLPIRGSR